MRERMSVGGEEREIYKREGERDDRRAEGEAEKGSRWREDESWGSWET